MNSEDPSFRPFSPPPANSNSSTARAVPAAHHHLRSSSQTSLSTIVKAQISFLLSTLTADNYEHNVAEIDSLIAQHGQDIYFHLLRRLLIDNQQKICNAGARSSDLITNSQEYRLLIGKVRQLASNPTLSSSFCDALNSIDNKDAFKDFDLSRFLEQVGSYFVSKVGSNSVEKVGLNSVEKVALSISLLAASRKDIKEQASNIITSEIDALAQSLKNSAGISEPLALHLALFLKSSQAESLNILPKQIDAVIEGLRSKFAPNSPPAALVPLLYNSSVSHNDLTSSTMKDTKDPAAILLAKIMMDHGYSCCSSPTAVRNLLNQIGITSPDSGEVIREDDVAQVFGLMARTHANLEHNSNWTPSTESTDVQPSWDVETFVTTLVELQPHLDWVKVIKELDHPEFVIYDVKGIEILMNGFKAATNDQQKFPIEVFWSQWKNIKGQFSFLNCLATDPSGKFDPNTYPVKRVVTMDDFANASQNVKSFAGILVAHPCNCVELLETLIKMADTELVDDVRATFERIAKSTPEVVFLGLAQIKKPWNALHQELVNRQLMMFLSGHSSGIFVLNLLWQLNSELFSEGCIELYNKDPANVSRILDLAQELKVLNPLLEKRPFAFAIDLAALASRRQYLNLEKWLTDNIANHGTTFVYECLDLLNHEIVTRAISDASTANQSPRLTYDVVVIFLRVLQGSQLSADKAEMLREIHDVAVRLYPRLLSLGSSADAVATNGEATFSEDVEAQANSYYESVYKGELGLKDFINLLINFKNSQDPHEKDVFDCMVHNLFDEHRFFPKYPPRELSITSVIFGSLIQYQLVGYLTLGIALRYVLTALRNPSDQKMLNFGIQALLQFQTRLPEWPQYCTQLLQIPHLHQSHPEIMQYVATALAENNSGSGESMIVAAAVGDPPTSPAVTATPSAESTSSRVAAETSSRVADSRPVFTALNLDTLLAAEQVDYEIPSEEVQDKILFIINNVAQSNLESKVSEMKQILKGQHYRWFANYLVVKRASIEPNYHQLYLQFLDQLDSQLLMKHVLHETFANVNVLLNSNKTVQSASERTLLKNLGSWLGGMTLARNKPIKHKNIAFKDLLVEGYDSNRLIVAIPFVCKVLEQASKSKVFKPPNPWLMAILRLLVELYQFAGLKLNLTFEIEVLCKSLSIELQDIEPTNILKDKKPLKDSANQQTDRLAQDMERMNINTPTFVSPGAKIAGQTSHIQPALGTLADEGYVNLTQSIAQHVVINSNLSIIASQIPLRKIVQLAIERAICETVTSIIDRAVMIAGISTRELIVKDFSMEPNEEKMRSAAHSMVQTLAGSLALVTCKDSLRQHMMAHLRSLLQQYNYSEAISEQAIVVIVTENLELASSIVKKIAREKAVPEIDEALASSFSNRKKHRERTGQPFYDMAVYSAVSRYVSNLPEPLRTKPNGLTEQQLQIYQDFGRIGNLARPSLQPYDDRPPRTAIHRQELAMGHLYGANELSFEPAHPQVAAMSAHQSLEKFAQYIAELENLIAKNPQASLASLQQNHEIRLIVNQILLLASTSYNRDETALAFSQKVVQLLYKNESNLSREIYVVLLERLCEISIKVSGEVTAWLIYADDDRKFIVPVVVALIKARLINTNEQDLQLARLIEAGRTTVIDFTAKLIRECTLKEPQIATRADFPNSLDALDRLARRGKAPESVIKLLDDLRRPARAPPIKEVENLGGLREQLSYYFTEWVRLYQHPASNEKVFSSFIMQVQQQGILKGDEVSSMFFRICTEMSVDNCLKQKITNQSSTVTVYQAIDAFSKLIVLLVKYHSDPEGMNDNLAKSAYFNKIVSLIVLVLAQAHEQRRQQFNQKPFFRLFSSLLSDLNAYEQQLQPIYFQLLTILSSTFTTLQPSFFPGFTFAWLSLISHRLFMPKLLLASENQKGWSAFHRLLISLFRFLIPFLRNVEMFRETTRLLYKGTLRVLLVLLHDFPEFLCDYHFSFCDVIPPSCIQLRNLILSAFPRNMRLPDPFTRNLKVDLLPEISQPPRVLSDYTSALTAGNLKQDIDNWLKTKQPASFLSELKNRLLADPGTQVDMRSKYNVPVINALVLYVGMQAINHFQNRQGHTPLTHTAHMELFQQLLNTLDSEGRYLFLSAIANQLRYPNSHTHYFSRTLLYLFADGGQEVIKEQVTRVLLERLIVNRPHPWGLLITFIELVKNPEYDFRSHSFTRCASDIERLFDNVNRSINQV